jgi:hypothetical protein
MARDPLPPELGIPALEPGSGDRTTPELSLFAPAVLGGARAEPTSPKAPAPLSLLPEPERLAPDEVRGGGGITLLASKPLPLPDPLEFLGLALELEPVPTDGGGGITSDALSEEVGYLPEVDPEVDPLPVELVFVLETDGGGGITLAADCDRPEVDPPRFERELPTEGGGGMTLAASEVPEPPVGLRDVPAALVEETAGGGGTTSCVPKSLPMMLLTIDPLAACVGGGGTTAGAVERMLPLSSRRKSREESAEGGGAMTEGAGRLSFAVRDISRSGAETGGGTTATLFICTRGGETSRVTEDGAGAIMLPLRAGAERA